MDWNLNRIMGCLGFHWGNSNIVGYYLVGGLEHVLFFHILGIS